MKHQLRILTLAVASFLIAASAAAQVLVLEDFGDGASTTGAVKAGTSWDGQLTPGATTLTVGGTALSDSGWGAINQTLNLSTYSYVVLSLQLSGSNAAPNIFVTFDDGTDQQTVTFTSASFNTVSVTTVYVPVTWTINPTTIEAWDIGGGVPPPGTGSPAFRMTFDTLAVAVVPEPSTYAAIAGVLALGFAAYRRRVARA